MRDIETAISEMLTENTGVNAFDSGGAYGRQWERNRKIESFDNEPIQTVEIYGTDDIIVSFNLYHYLVGNLDTTRDSETLTSGLYLGADESETGLEMMREFLDDPNIETLCDIKNSYNYDNILGGIIQYGIFRYESEYSIDEYVILQIHTGCDARAGYTMPQIYKIDDLDLFISTQFEVAAACECTDYFSEDSGHTYDEDTTSWEYDETLKIIRCNNCGSEVYFSAMNMC